MADCTQVVASCEEWKTAQSSEKQIAALKRRLDDAVGPVLDAEDFQWPWFEMSGEHWDNENRYEDSVLNLRSFCLSARWLDEIGRVGATASGRS